MPDQEDQQDVQDSDSLRTEADRLIKKNRFTGALQRPEIGPFGVMILLLLALGVFSAVFSAKRSVVAITAYR